MDGSLCSFQQYLYDRWATCPPVARVPGDFLPVEGPLGRRRGAHDISRHMVYGKKMAQTKCFSQRLADKPPSRIAFEPSYSPGTRIGAP